MKRLVLAALAVWGAAVIAIGCTGSKDEKRGEEVALPGDEFYPESLTGDSDGNLYTGSIAHGQVVRISKGGDVSMFITSNSSPGLTGVSGVLVDEPNDRFYICAIDFFASPPVEDVRVFDLHDGTPITNYTFPGIWLCNDLAVDAAGKLYIADSAGRILTTGTGSQLVVWTAGPKLMGTGTAGLASIGADGLAWEGETLWVNNLARSSLVKIPRVSGVAGSHQSITLSPAITYPDGMRLDGAGTLLVAEAVGFVTRIVVTGTTGATTVIGNVPGGPTSIFRSVDGLWASEGQLAYIFGLSTTPPTVPFRILKIDETQ